MGLQLLVAVRQRVWGRRGAPCLGREALGGRFTQHLPLSTADMQDKGRGASAQTSLITSEICSQDCGGLGRVEPAPALITLHSGPSD